VGIHKKGLSEEVRGASEEWMGERFASGKNYHDDIGFSFFSECSKCPQVALILRLKNSKAKKMDMSCIPGKIIGH